LSDEREPWEQVMLTEGVTFYVSTILRDSSAIGFPVRYYETMAFSIPGRDVLYEYAAGSARKAKRAHDTIAKRLGRLESVKLEGASGA
jgi:hypothetical protein